MIGGKLDCGLAIAIATRSLATSSSGLRPFLTRMLQEYKLPKWIRVARLVLS